MKLKLVSDYKKRLDKLCREVVMLRDRSCQWCGKTRNLQWCHVNSRRYLSTRWSMNNTLALCAGCHLRGHHRPLEFVDWFKEKFPDRWMIMRAAGQGKVDPHGTFLWLMQEKKRLESEQDRVFDAR